MNNKYPLIIGLFFSILVILMLVYSFVINRKPQSSTQATPTTFATPTLIPGEDVFFPTPTFYQETKQYIEKQKEIAATEAPFHNQNEKVGELLNKVPYQGQNFRFEFDNQQLAFKVTLSNEKKDEANAEFDQFLKTNNVMDRSWIQDLIITYE
jgi:hypothetical protein